MEHWLEKSPPLNVERMRAPLLIWAGGQIHTWESCVLLKRAKKPVEYWLSADLEHDVFKVSQRVLLNNLFVDWFDFWLNGNEESDPAKAEQYERWRELRNLHEADLINGRPPLLDWEAIPIPGTEEPPRVSN